MFNSSWSYVILKTYLFHTSAWKTLQQTYLQRYLYTIEPIKTYLVCMRKVMISATSRSPKLITFNFPTPWLHYTKRYIPSFLFPCKICRTLCTPLRFHMFECCIGKFVYVSCNVTRWVLMRWVAKAANWDKFW